MLGLGYFAAWTASHPQQVKAVAADPSIVPKVQALAAKYKSEIATAQQLKPATIAALTANPTDQAAGIEAHRAWAERGQLKQTADDG